MAETFEAAFDHFHMKSLDPEAAGRFYVDLLGATFVSRAEMANGGLRVSIRFSGVDLFIDRAPADTAACRPRPFMGLEHFGVKVPDLDKAAADLKAKGVEFTLDPVDFRPGLRIAFIKGPDGAEIELLERKPV